MNITNIAENIDTDWRDIIKNLLFEYGDTINEKLNHDANLFENVLDIVPPSHLIFNAFNMFDEKELKVCIIGMDPYIHKGEAMGLSFSVPREQKKCPPSLRNIFKELENEYNVRRTNTDLTDWAKQGVLLLNTALTTLETKTGHHMRIWKDFTEAIIKYIAHHHKQIVYILWGAHAQSFEHLIDPQQNLILKHSHPSPLSRKPFVGNQHFQKCNEYLKKNDLKEIQWIDDV